MKQKQLTGNRWLLCLVIVLLLYGVLLACYLMNFISSFLFVGLLFIIIIIPVIFLIYYRKDHKERNMLLVIICCIMLLIVYEVPLTQYEGYTFKATGYREPEELIDQSGIYLMSVGLHDIFYLDNEEDIRKNFALNHIEIYELYETTNLDRYKSKFIWLLHLVGLYKDKFHIMKENVQDFVGYDVEIVNEFLTRDDLEGDSAGLALSLTAMFAQGELENEIPIGVTGTLEKDGRTLAVGGMKEKMLIAEEHALPYLIIPEENKQLAMELKEDLSLKVEILPVNHIDEAIIVIRELNKKSDIGE